MTTEVGSLLEQLAPGLRRRVLRRRGRLVDMGQVSEALYLVETGCLRLFHLDAEGNDVTLQFFLGGDLVGSFNSLVGGVPSRYGIEAVVESQVRVLPRARLLRLLDGDKAIRDAAFSYLMRRLADYQSLFLDTIRSTPQERHAWLQARSPELFDIVPQHYIASYLGITPVSLSRIRKRAAGINKG